MSGVPLDLASVFLPREGIALDHPDHLSTADFDDSGSRYCRILRRDRQKFAHGDDRENGL